MTTMLFMYPAIVCTHEWIADNVMAGVANCLHSHESANFIPFLDLQSYEENNPPHNTRVSAYRFRQDSIYIYVITYTT